MKVNDAQLDKLLGLETCQAIKEEIARRKLLPSLPQVRKLRGRLSELGVARRELKIAVIHTYTSELLDPWLLFSAELNELALDLYHAPYGVTFQEAAEASGLRRHDPDITVLLMRREDFHPALAAPVAGIQGEDRERLTREVIDAASGLAAQIRGAVGGHIVFTVLPAMSGLSLGSYDAMSEHSESAWWNDLKRQLASRFRQSCNGLGLLDLDEIVSEVGREQFFDPRLWYMSKFPFAPRGAMAISDAISRIAASQALIPAKVIVLDADNTLWGGVIGEDGLQGIALGPDYPGSAYLEFQRRILGLQQRGFILALCSKNNPEDVEEVFRDHPHQLLKPEHFAARRVNWVPKPDNLQSIAEELNLGLDSFIFADDSDYECAAVRHKLPAVEVVQVPANPMDVPACLDSVARLEIVSLTAEDLQKTAMYAQEQLRKSELVTAQSSGDGIQDYLRSLEMRMTVGRDVSGVLPRLAQLTQKTNQFNLTTRRYTEQDVAERIVDPAWWVFHFSLADKFGDSGIVGLAMVEKDSASSARIDTFLMSCRVIGRMAENAFLEQILYTLAAEGIENVSAEYIPTPENVLVERFLPDNGFQAAANGFYTRALGDGADATGDIPITIEVWTGQ